MKLSFLKSGGLGVWKVIVGLIAIVASSLVGAYFDNAFAIKKSQERTEQGTHTLIGLAQDVKNLALKKDGSEELLLKVDLLVQQARAVEHTITLLGKKDTSFSLLPDFWLRKNSGCILNKTIPFGISGERGNAIYVNRNGGSGWMRAGDKYDYETADKEKCYVTYVGKIADSGLYGFKIGRNDAPNN